MAVAARDLWVCCQHLQALLVAWSGPGDLRPKLLGWSSCHAAAPPHIHQITIQAVHLQHKHMTIWMIAMIIIIVLVIV